MEFGESSTRVLSRTSANPGGFGFFDIGTFTPTFSQMVLPAAINGASVRSYEWQRSAPLPVTAFFVADATPTSPPTVFSALINGTLTQIGTLPTGSLWSLDAVSANNQTLFVRNESTGAVVQVAVATGAQTAFAGATPASGPAQLSRNDQRLVYASGSSLGVIAVATGTASTITLPLIPGTGGTMVAPTVEALHWIDDRFMVALLSNGNPGGIGQIHRIDVNAGGPAGVVPLTFPFSGTIQPYYRDMSVSGDGQWLTAVREQSALLGAFERTVVVMRLTNGTSTSPGGSLNLLDANLESTTTPGVSVARFNVVDDPIIQSRPFTPLEPIVFFQARETAVGSSLTTYSASLERNISISTRAVPSLSGTTPLDIAGKAGVNDLILIVYASLDRIDPPVTLPLPDVVGPLFINNPVDVFQASVSSGQDFQGQIQLAASPSGPFNQRMYLQPMWVNFPPSGAPVTFDLSRLVELPVF